MQPPIDPSSKEEEGEERNLVSLFDPSVKDELRGCFKKSIVVQILITVMMISMINILYTFSWNPTPHLKKKMRIAIASSEPSSAVITKSLKMVIDQAHSLNLNYKFVLVNDGDNDNGLVDEGKVIDDVEKGRYWGAFIVHQNASVNLLRSLPNDFSGTYNPSSVSTFWYSQARAGSSYQYVLPSLGNQLASYTSLYTKEQLFADSVTKGYNISHFNPSVISNPVSVFLNNLNPVKNIGVHTAIGGGMMQFFLASALQAIVVLSLHADLDGRGIIKAHLVRFSALHRVLGAGVLALWPSVVLLMLGIGTETMTANTFFQWWAFCWVVMSTLVGIIFAMVKLLTPPVGLIFGMTLLFLMVSSSEASLPMDGMPDFFRIGFGLPFLNAVQGSRAILLGSNENFLPRNIGIFFIYITLFIILGFYLSYANVKKFHIEEDDLDEEVRVREENRVRRLSEASLQSANLSDLERVHPDPSADRDEKTDENEKTDGEEDVTQFNFQKSQSQSIKSENQPTNNTNISDSVVHASTVPAPSANLNPDPKGEPLFDNVSIFDPSLRPVIKSIIIKGIVVEIFLSFFFMAILLLTYGNTWDPTQYFDKIDIAVLNCDNGDVGATVMSALKIYQKDTPYKFTANILNCSYHSYDSVVEDVRNYKYWGGLIVHSGASLRLTSSLYNNTAKAKTDYESGYHAATFVLDAGRNGNLMVTWLKLWSGGVVGTANVMYSIIQSTKLAAKNAVVSALNIGVLSNPISVNQYTLNNPKYSGVDGTINSAGMGAYLGTTVTVSIISLIQKPLADNSKVKYTHRTMLKAFHIVVASTISSFIPVISLLWVGFDFNGGQFFAYWALMALGMCAFASFVVADYHALGQAGGGMANIIVFALNQASSTATLPHELQNPFFQIGYAMPYQQILTAGRHILFNTRNNYGRAIGVLFAWLGTVSLIAYRLEIRRSRLSKASQIVKRSYQSVKEKLGSQKSIRERLGGQVSIR